MLNISSFIHASVQSHTSNTKKVSHYTCNQIRPRGTAKHAYIKSETDLITSVAIKEKISPKKKKSETELITSAAIKENITKNLYLPFNFLVKSNASHRAENYSSV